MNNAATEAIISFVGTDKGLLKVLDASAKSVGRLSSATNTGIDNFAKYEDSASLAEKAIASIGDSAVSTTKSVTGFSRASVSGYRDVTNAATKTVSVADALDNKFVGLTTRALGVNKQFRAVNEVLQPTAGFFSEVGDEATFAGKAFTVLDASEKPLVKGLNLGSTATRDLAKTLSELGVVGESTANVLLKVSDSLGMASRTVGITDTIGDVFQLTESIGEFAKGVPDQISGIMGFKESLDESGASALIMSKQMVIATQAAGFLATRTTGLTSNLSKLFLAGVQFQQVANYVKVFSDAITSAYLQTKDLNTTFGVLQSLGIETTFAELALEIGVFGEQLLVNTEVAKKFVNTTVSAFAQLQDSLAFVATLSPAAAVGIPKMGKAIQDLVNGPLENMITSQDASQALYTTMSAGMTDVSEATNFMGTALKLAAATGTDANTTIEALVKTGLSYKTAYRDVGKIAGELNQVVEEGIVTFPQLAGGLAEVAGVAAQIGVAREELLGLTSALTYTKGGAGALEGISSLLNSIAGQGEQSQKAIAELGIRFDLQSIKAKGLKKNLDELYKAVRGDTSKLKIILPDSLAFETAIAIMTSASERADSSIKKVAAAGEENLEKLFGARQQSLIKEASALMNGFREQMIQFGEKLLPVLEPGLEFLRSLLERFQNLPEPVKDLIGSMVLFNLTMGKAVGIGQTFMGLLFGLAKAYLMSRLASLAFTGGVRGTLAELQKIGQLVAAKDFGGALARLFDTEGLKNKAEVAKGIVANTNNTLAQSRGLNAAAAIKEALGSAAVASANAQEALSALQLATAKQADAQASVRAAAARVNAARSSLQEAAANTSAAKAAVDAALAKEANAQATVNSTATNTSAARSALALAQSESTTAQAVLRSTIATQASAQSRLQGAMADKVAGQEALRAATATTVLAKTDLESALTKEDLAKANAQATIAQRTKTQADVQARIATQAEAQSSLVAAAANTSNAETALANATARRVQLQVIAETSLGNSALVQSELRASLATEASAAAALESAAAREVESRATFENAAANTAAAQSGLEASLASKVASGNAKFATIEAAQSVAVIASANTREAQSLLEVASARTINAQSAVESAAARVSSTAVIHREAQANVVAAASALTSATASQSSTQAEIASAAAHLRSTTAIESNAAAAAQSAISDKVAADAALESSRAEQLNAQTHLQSALATEQTAQANVRATVAQRTKTQADLESIIAQENAAIASFSAASAESTNAQANLSAATAKRAYLETIVATSVGNSAAANAELRSAIVAESSAKAAYSAAVAKKTEAQATLDLAAANTAAARAGLAANSGAGAGVIGIFGKMGQAATAAGGFIAGAFKFASEGVKVFWATLGPITVALGLITAAFMVLQDFTPALGGAAGDSQKLAQGLEKVAIAGKKAEEAVEGVTKKTREYSGFINTAALPILNRFVKNALGGFRLLDAALNKISGGKIDLNIGEWVDKQFTAVKDTVEDARSLDVWEAINLASKTTDERLKETQKKITNLKVGDFMSKEAKKIIEANQGTVLSSEEMREALAAEQRSLENTKKANDQYVAGLQEQLNATKDPKQKAAIQEQIDSINASTSAMEKAVTAQQKYIDNLNSIGTAIQENNAGKSSTSVLSTLEETKNQLEKDFQDLPESAKGAFRDTFALLEENLNLTSNMQRRKATNLINATKNFMDNIKKQSVVSPDELTNLRRDADDFLSKIDEALVQGTIGEDVANKLREQLSSQEIEVPEFNFKGNFLSADQSEAINKSTIESIQRQGKRVTDQQQISIERYKTLEATRVLSSSESNKLIAEEEANISQNRLTTQRIVLGKLKKEQGEASQVYKDQLLMVQTLEQEVTVKREQSRRSGVDAELQNVKDYAERNQSLADLAVLQGNMSEKEGFDRRNKLRDAELKAQEQIQLKELALVESRGGSTVSIEAEIAKIRVEIQKNAIDKITDSYNRQRKAIANTTTEITQSLTEQSNTLNVLTAELGLQQKLMQSRNSLSQQSAAFVEGELASVVKSTSSQQLRAVLEGRSAALRLKNLRSQQAFEQESLELQERMNTLSLERDVIQNEIAQAENQRALALANIDLIEARRLGKSQGEIESLDLQIRSLQQSGDLLTRQAGTLAESKVQQDEIVKNSRTELELKQELARRGGVLDVQLAKQNQLTESFNKQKDLLERQKNLISARSGFIDSELELLAKVEQNERRRQDIARLMAITKFNSLKQQQEMERRILNLQLLQEKSLLEQEKSRNRVAKLDTQADIAQAKADLSESAASGASPQIIEARFKRIKALLEKAAALESEGQELVAREQTQKEFGDAQKYEQRLGDTSEINQALAAIAETLPEGQQNKAMRALENRLLQQLGVGSFGTSINDTFKGIRAYNEAQTARIFGEGVAPLTATDAYTQELSGVVGRGLGSVAPTPTITPPPSVDYESIRRNFLSQLEEFTPLLSSSTVGVPATTLTTPQAPVPTLPATSTTTLLPTTRNAVAEVQPIQLTGDLNVQNTVQIQIASPEDRQIGTSVENAVLDSLDGVFKMVRQRMQG